MANGKSGETQSSWGLINLVAIVVVLGVLILGGSALGTHVLNKQSQKSVAGAEFNFQPVVEKTIVYDGQNGKTALDILKTSHEVTSEDSSIGAFVTKIDDFENKDDKYWMFYVNGDLATLGADQFQTKDGQKIEWRYGAIQ